MVDQPDPIEAPPDLLTQMSADPFVHALAALIWSELDAHAKTVRISVERDGAGHISAYTLADNGSASASSSTTVAVPALNDHYRSLLTEEAAHEALTEIFAPYLCDDPDTEIWLGNRRLDPASSTVRRRSNPTHHLRQRAADDARDHVNQWKLQRVYPFPEEPRNAVEQMERQVFDIVAAQVARHLPEFDGAGASNKSFQLRMLRQALEKSPQELQRILTEVLKLSRREQDDLADLLRDVSLSAIISSARVVADRLQFLTGLEAILFDHGSKKRLKERSQLHRIVAQNTWLFGEEFALAVDDQSLTEVLRKHRHFLNENTVIDAPVRHVSQQRGIVDLMLSKMTRRHRANTLSHLVVELKAPRVKLDGHEIYQIEGYAASVTADERFRNVDVQWQFWAISDDLGPVGQFRVGRGDGRIMSQDNVSIHLKTWAQVIDENRARLQFYQDRLEYQADRAASLKHLRTRYGRFLTGVLEDPVPGGRPPPPAGRGRNPQTGAQPI